MLGIIDDMWWNWVSDFGLAGEFMTPPPEITKDGVKPYPSDGARKLNARLWLLYSVTGITPAMQCTRCCRKIGAPRHFADLCHAEQTTAEIREEFKRVSEMARKTGLLK